MTAERLSDAGADEPPFPGFRFPEAAALFNPALGAVILNFAAQGHVDDSGAGLPWLAAFLAVPLALHPPTRDSLPRDIRTSMASWVTAHPVLRDGFNLRTAALAQITREALRFALHARVVALESTRLVPVTRIQRPTSRDELRSCVDAARLFGRWMARTDLVTAYQLLGVRP
jgi:Family of unknown function (DUF6521)